MNDRHQTKPYPLRMPEDLRSRLEDSAKANGRSLNAEIIQRLDLSMLDGNNRQDSFSNALSDFMKPLIEDVMATELELKAQSLAEGVPQESITKAFRKTLTREAVREALERRRGARVLPTEDEGNAKTSR